MLALTDVLPDAPTTTTDALALFDSRPAVEPESMLGSWHGAELPTGHPLDGMLAASGWWGKHFRDSEYVHPLLFPTADGSALWALNPAPAFAVTPAASSQEGEDDPGDTTARWLGGSGLAVGLIGVGVGAAGLRRRKDPA